LNKALQRDWNTYGGESFTFEILVRVKPEEEIVTDFHELEKNGFNSLSPTTNKDIIQNQRCEISKARFLFDHVKNRAF
jgi:hypothetical protein